MSRVVGGQPLAIGRVVIYRSRTGNYDVPALVNCTQDSIYPPGVEAGYVPALSEPHSVHLTVLTPGIPGKRATAADFVGDRAEAPISENVAGTYQEWDVPYDETRAPGTWSWPKRT